MESSDLRLEKKTSLDGAEIMWVDDRYMAVADWLGIKRLVSLSKSTGVPVSTLFDFMQIIKEVELVKGKVDWELAQKAFGWK